MYGEDALDPTAPTRKTASDSDVARLFGFSQPGAPQPVSQQPVSQQPAAPLPGAKTADDAAVARLFGFAAPSPALVTSLSQAATANPDTTAKALRIGRELSIHPDLVNPVSAAGDVFRKKHNASEIATNSPGLGKALEDPVVARVAADSISSLSDIERVAMNIGKTLKSFVPATAESFLGVAQSGVDWAVERLIPTDLPQDVQQQMRGMLPLDVTGAITAGRAKLHDAAVRVGPDLTGAGPIERGVVGGVQSVGQTAILLTAALAAKKPQLLLGGAVTLQYGDSYNKGSDAGLSPEANRRYAGTDALLEGVFEALPAAALLKGAKGGGLRKMVKDFLIADVPGEQATRHLQDLNEWITLNPAKPFSDYMKERPDAALETLAATVVGGGLQLSAAHGLSKVFGQPKNAEASAAVTGFQAMQDLEDLVNNVPLKNTDPETFNQVMKTLVEQPGAVKTVFVDAAVLSDALNASGVTSDILTKIPDLANSITEAATRHGDVGISVADYATHIIGTPVADTLREHVKVSDDGMTFDAAKAYFQTTTPESVAAAQVLTKEEFLAKQASEPPPDRRVLGPDGKRPERRQDTATRASITDSLAALATPAEREAFLVKELHTDALTGLGNARAYESAPKLAVQGSIDADSLKWINDNMTPASGDAMLKAIGDAFKQVTDNAYHVSGDEYMVQGHTSEEVNALVEKAQSVLRDAIVTVELPDGTTVEKRGIDITHGIGGTKNEADINLKKEKLRRESAGLRAGRGNPPKGVSSRPTSGQQDNSSAPTKQTYEEYLASHPNQESVLAADSVAVKNTIKGMLDSANRFSSAVNETNATVIAAWYETMAARIGVAPSALYSELPLKIAAVGGAGYKQKTSQLESFKKWYTGAKLVDANGDPVRLYHGTSQDLASFSGEHKFKKDAGWYGQGVYLTASTSDASAYSRYDTLGDAATGGAPNVMPVYTNLKNPYMWPKGRSIALTEKDSIALTKELMAQGYDGVVVNNAAGGTHTESKFREVIAFLPPGVHPVKSAVGNITFGDNSDLLRQDANNGVFDPTTLTIGLLEGANLSTVIHESAHFFLEGLVYLANRPGAHARLLADADKGLALLGTTRADWGAMTLEQRRPLHEQWAESFELYALEGKAPSEELRPVFRRMRSWMLKVYKSVEQFLAKNPSGGKLDDELRSIFQRQLASETAIKHMEAQSGFASLFPDKPEKLSEAGYEDYNSLGEAATGEAIDVMERRSLKDMKWLSRAKNKALKALQAEAEDKRKVIRAEVTAEVMAEPINQARSLLLDNTSNIKLNTSDVKEFGFEPLSLRGMTNSDTVLSIDEVADMFGFKSSITFLTELVHGESSADKIAGLTDKRMLEENGELIDPWAIEDAANAAVHNPGRAKFMATGLKILTGGSTRDALSLASSIAKDTVDTMKVGAISPKSFRAAEAKAGKLALSLVAKDPRGAAAAQRSVLLNNRLESHATKALAEVDKGLAFAKTVEKALANRGLSAEFSTQLGNLLGRFGLSESPQDPSAPTLAVWLEAESDKLSAVAPDIADWISTSGYSADYKDLTMAQMRDVLSAVKSFDLLARRVEGQYTAVRNMTFSMERDAIVARIEKSNPQAFKAKKTTSHVPSLAPTGLSDKLIGYGLSAENIINVLENGELGQVHESLFKRMSDGVNSKADKLLGVYKLMQPYMSKYSLKDRLAFSRKDIGAVAGERITRENAVTIALLHGSEDGRQRLRDSYGWTDAQQLEAVNLLDSRDLDLVEGVWSLFDNTLWPELEALNIRTRGKAPPKIAPATYTVGTRVLSGGYYKLKYADRPTEIDNPMALLHVKPSTQQGGSVERVEGVKLKPRLDLGVFVETVNETIHDIALREAVADTVRLLNDKRVKQAIKTSAGEAQYHALVDNLEDAARIPHPVSKVSVEGILSMARRNTVVALMSGLGTALQNVTGWASSAARLKNPALLVKEVVKFAAHPVDMHKFAVTNSVYMKHRGESFDREISSAARKLTVNGKIIPDAHTFLWLFSQMDKLVSVTTWNAAYREGMTKHGNDVRLAVESADQLVRQTQGSGRGLDASKVMSTTGATGQLRAVFTMFGSYYNSQLGLLVRSGIINKRLAKDHPAFAAALFAKDVMLVVAVPAILTAALFSGNTPDDPEETATHKYLIALAKYTSSLVPVLGGFLNTGIDKYTNSTPDYGLKLSPVQSAFEGVLKTPQAIDALLNSEGTTKDTKNAIMGASYAVGLPGKLIANTVTGVDAVYHDDAGPKALIYGAPKEAK